MQRTIVLGVLGGLLLFTQPVHAASESVGEGMAAKAVRGAINLVTGIVELPMQVYKGYKNGFAPIENTAGSKTVGTVLGFFKGVSHSAGRIGWGGLELFGFWSANRVDNEGVGLPFDAEYAWEMGEPYNVFEPSLAEGLKPIPVKLGHGFADGILGILEVPGQAIIGSREGNVWKGLGKGVWFWWSRQIYGFGNIYGALFPNPSDNPGYPLSHDWAWESLTE